MGIVWDRRGKRRLLACPACALLLACLLCLGACASGSGGQSAAFVLDVELAGERLYQELAYRDTLEELDPALLFLLLGIEEGQTAAQKNYFSSGATAEEIVVLHAKDREALEMLRAALEAHLAYQMEIYASYAPEEVSYLKDAVLMDQGDYLIYCVSAEPEKAAQLAAELLVGSDGRQG